MGCPYRLYEMTTGDFVTLEGQSRVVRVTHIADSKESVRIVDQNGWTIAYPMNMMCKVFNNHEILNLINSGLG